MHRGDQVLPAGVIFVPLRTRNTKPTQAWPPLVGNPTGTYCLDMADKRHRVAARRLAMINHAERAHGYSGDAGHYDTTQVQSVEVYRSKKLQRIGYHFIVSHDLCN